MIKVTILQAPLIKQNLHSKLSIRVIASDCACKSCRNKNERGWMGLRWTREHIEVTVNTSFRERKMLHKYNEFQYTRSVILYSMMMTLCTTDHVTSYAWFNSNFMCVLHCIEHEMKWTKESLMMDCLSHARESGKRTFAPKHKESKKTSFLTNGNLTKKWLDLGKIPKDSLRIGQFVQPF